MKLLDRIVIPSESGDRTVELYHGDLTDMPPQHSVDVLVVSAFPDTYGASAGTLIGALKKKGISVKNLAKSKASDMREQFSCWMSGDIVDDIEGIAFKRILCFEPLAKGNPSEVVGDIFQSLMPFIYAKPKIKSIAMPLVATGKQKIPLDQMLEPLLDAAVNWLRLGLPVKTIKIVEFNELKAAELKGAFSVLKKKFLLPLAEVKPAKKFAYDFFISYSHEDKREVDALFNGLKKQHPELKIWIDQKILNTGAAWQQEIYEALDNCEKVIAVYSPTYLTSKVCKEEYNIAMLRHRDSDEGVLVPLYLYSANLPSYMQLIQFLDCREFDLDKIEAVCKTIYS